MSLIPIELSLTAVWGASCGERSRLSLSTSAYGQMPDSEQGALQAIGMANATLAGREWVLLPTTDYNDGVIRILDYGNNHTTAGAIGVYVMNPLATAPLGLNSNFLVGALGATGMGPGVAMVAAGGLHKTLKQIGTPTTKEKGYLKRVGTGDDPIDLAGLLESHGDLVYGVAAKLGRTKVELGEAELTRRNKNAPYDEYAVCPVNVQGPDSATVSLTGWIDSQLSNNVVFENSIAPRRAALQGQMYAVDQAIVEAISSGVGDAEVSALLTAIGNVDSDGPLVNAPAIIAAWKDSRTRVVAIAYAKDIEMRQHLADRYEAYLAAFEPSQGNELPLSYVDWLSSILPAGLGDFDDLPRDAHGGVPASSGSALSNWLSNAWDTIGGYGSKLMDYASENPFISGAVVGAVGSRALPDWVLPAALIAGTLVVLK